MRPLPVTGVAASAYAIAGLPRLVGCERGGDAAGRSSCSVGASAAVQRRRRQGLDVSLHAAGGCLSHGTDLQWSEAPITLCHRAELCWKRFP